MHQRDAACASGTVELLRLKNHENTVIKAFNALAMALFRANAIHY
jgi:hypothetical protein